jgi:hypothetical protein
VTSDGLLLEIRMLIPVPSFTKKISNQRNIRKLGWGQENKL